MSETRPQKSPQTVTPSGESVRPLIHGVRLHHPVTQLDERGSLCEIYHPAWGFDEIPLVTAYLVTVRPGWVKGWAFHRQQVDRYFFSHGKLKLVLYDAREDSPTHEMLNELYFDETNRALVSVPPGIYHAIENVGQTEAWLFNLPSEPYDHADPDKYTLPLDNDVIPYGFGLKRGY